MTDDPTSPAAIAPSVSGPFTRWDAVPAWTDPLPDDPALAQTTPRWAGRRLVFGGAWLLQMQIERGYHWAHRHPQSQVVWVDSGELLVRVGDPEGSDSEHVAEQVLRSGDLLLIPSNVWHDLTALSDVQAWEARGMEGSDEWERWCVPLTGPLRSEPA